jgi:electron transport complex protein RnfB
MVNTVIASGGLLVGLGFAFGYVLAYASRRFYVEVDGRVAQIEEVLPGFNCAACGQAGCSAFAEAVVAGKTPPNGCAPGREETARKVAAILGVEVEEKQPTVATVHCGGGLRCKDKFSYTGVASCAQANLLAGGHKACSYGCLGFGDCVAVCPFDAIHMGEDGIPFVDPKKCTACGLCVKACPKKIIELTPKSKRYHVLCSSKDKAAIVRSVCSVGCIGCGLCVKNCPNQACTLEENLSRINYAKCENIGKCAQVCPTKCIKELPR